MTKEEIRKIKVGDKFKLDRQYEHYEEDCQCLLGDDPECEGCWLSVFSEEEVMVKIVRIVGGDYYIDKQYECANRNSRFYSGEFELGLLKPTKEYKWKKI